MAVVWLAQRITKLNLQPRRNYFDIQLYETTIHKIGLPLFESSQTPHQDPQSGRKALKFSFTVFNGLYEPLRPVKFWVPMHLGAVFCYGFTEIVQRVVFRKPHGWQWTDKPYAQEPRLFTRNERRASTPSRWRIKESPRKGEMSCLRDMMTCESRKWWFNNYSTLVRFEHNSRTTTPNRDRFLVNA